MLFTRQIRRGCFSTTTPAHPSRSPAPVDGRLPPPVSTYFTASEYCVESSLSRHRSPSLSGMRKSSSKMSGFSASPDSLMYNFFLSRRPFGIRPRWDYLHLPEQSICRSPLDENRGFCHPLISYPNLLCVLAISAARYLALLSCQPPATRV